MTSTARIIGHVDLNKTARQKDNAPSAVPEDFLQDMVTHPWSSDQVRQELQRVLAEIDELQSQNRWEDIIALFFPFDHQIPLLIENGMADEVMQKVAFALGRAGRHQEAIDTLQELCGRDPENAHVHYNLGYTTLDLLFTIRTKRRPMPAGEKAKLIKLAHHHFQQARALRPSSVTFPYREAMLFKEIEGKSYKAIPLFEQAIANWKKLGADEQQRQHQQRPKYIKAMYHLASCLLEKNRPGKALRLLQTMMAQDEESNYMHPLFKHYALAKILQAQGKFREALDHLETAAARADKEQAQDFVWELAARCQLQLKQPEKAAACIDRIPVFQRRPYIRWTESDVLVAQGKTGKALQILEHSAQRDRRSRHKSLVRMARIRLAQGKPDLALNHCLEANKFCTETFGNESFEVLFWQAASLYRLGRFQEGLSILEMLEEHHFTYPNMSRLRQALEDGVKSEDKVPGSPDIVLYSKPSSGNQDK